MTLTQTIQKLREQFGDKILATTEFRDEQTLNVSREDLHEILGHCKTSLGFAYLVDISSIDNMGEDPRFEMVYELYSYDDRIHLRIKADVAEDDLTVPTVTDLWSTAEWHEREVYDMMGIEFAGHPDLRRILMWEGYPYYPLRKDFPLAGKPSDVPEIAFTEAAPLAGGPFVTEATEGSTIAREPRSRE